MAALLASGLGRQALRQLPKDAAQTTGYVLEPGKDDVVIPLCADNFWLQRFFGSSHFGSRLKAEGSRLKAREHRVVLPSDIKVDNRF